MEEATLAQRARCAGNQCFALFQDPNDFFSAKSSCKGSEGQLFVLSLDQADERLNNVTGSLSGRYWLSGGAGTTAEAGPGQQRCSYVSVTTGGGRSLSWTLCSDRLDGYLCEYAFETPCGRLQPSGGAHVKYVTHMGFEVSDSETFPPGTVAVAEKAGGKYPDSKHVCFEFNWLPAPWRCEVLNGGCEQSCNEATHTCVCPARETLHPNNFTCTKKPCADCAHECQRDGDSYVCRCPEGYRHAQDRGSCVDVDECKEKDPCAGVGEECVNTQGGFQCRCRDDFEEEDGACVDVAICDKCEHMRCEKFSGVYRCVCRAGFRVSPGDPTKCEQACAERECPAKCIADPDTKEDMEQCFCPEGYIHDIRDDALICTDIDECDLEKQCDHKCENFFGGFRCLCDEGYELEDDYTCLPTEEERDVEGSGLSSTYRTPVGAQPAAVPSYVKTGSVLGIAVFVLLCAGLLWFLVRNMTKRCGKFDLYSLKGPDIDIFYLQQVTTDTYKRLSFDKQVKNESQRV